ncbi:hypothetical protein CLAFUW4_00122 [Fulvia fulva]|uniref:F-box domain-containing protein n=1 Tax=Passalora fulva TaxID=5499 RepID=A0A9Q8L7Y6_PASFU|nr:uncharacterized protein CLAFUR5_00121 [Fulvia fulva]KAK4638647.1 hypothetical protein CLAFUR0_00120 [Fulvia fulva]UJO12484.1 hypothetical protein CLAFUR5_00121 [Fulvia fulva]WPV09179.1 hypothetical protein CLAFUW4_00122 [Fulvia fulva]WPV25180.1 hypothetical protein CLAFUW7_00122 [Fulvia fulva]
MGLSAATEQKPRAYILDLPTELLQHIAGRCGGETIVTLRLTCREIEAATRDMWAKEYVSRLECFMLDPVRLKRVKVSARTSPAQYSSTTDHVFCPEHPVRGVVFTLSVWDSFTTSPLYFRRRAALAPEGGQTHEHALGIFEDNYEVEQYDAHACEFEGLPPKAETLILECIRIAAALENCSLGVDTQCEDVNSRKISRCRPQLVKDMIDVSLREGCAMTHLIICDSFPLQAAHFEQGSALQSVTSGIEYLSYLLRPGDEDALLSTWTQNHLRIMAQVLEKAQKLHYLQIMNQSTSRNVDYGEAMPDLFAQSFAGFTTLKSLRILRLDAVNLKARTFQKLLMSCTNTLHTIEVMYIGLLGEDDVRGNVFRLLHDMPRLRTLLVHSVYRRPGEATAFAREGWSAIRWKKPTDQVATLWKEMGVMKSVDARTFLGQAVKHEIEYYPA